jgi:hypothetical protein
MSDEVQTGRLIPYLVEMFRYQAWVSMGKVANPATGKVERELPVARVMIDMLGELETRTEGHRSGEETRMLQGALTDLRLNYLEEMKKSPAEPEKPEQGEQAEGNTGEETEEEPAAEAPASETAGPESKKESKTTEQS